MTLIVTGSIGIDTVHTPHGSAERVLGGSCTYFAAAAAFFGPVRLVAAVGGDFREEHHGVLKRFPNVCVDGIEVRPDSKTFAWGGKYLDNMNDRETLFTELGVLAEPPPTPPPHYSDSRYVFLANTHPGVQLELLEHFPDRAFAVADTMNLWIDTARDELAALLKQVDGLVLNDEESRLLVGERNPITAGRRILDLGPTFAVIKKGEHGCILVHREGVAALPAYPLEQVIDPTGAGDSFAGGMMGAIASGAIVVDAPAAARERERAVRFDTIQRSLAHGTVIASFTVEAFSLDRLASIRRDDVDARLREFQRIVRVG